MEKIVKVTVNIENARKALALAGFWKIAESGTDDAVFERVLEMLHSYCARTEIIEPPIAPDAVGLLTAMAILAEPIDPRAEDGSAGFTSMFSEFDDDVCNDGVAF